MGSRSAVEDLAEVAALELLDTDLAAVMYDAGRLAERARIAAGVAELDAGWRRAGAVRNVQDRATRVAVMVAARQRMWPGRPDFPGGLTEPMDTFPADRDWVPARGWSPW